MLFEDHCRLISAIRMTAGALRREADYVEPRDSRGARSLRRRARAFDTRAAELERGLTAHPGGPQAAP